MDFDLESEEQEQKDPNSGMKIKLLDELIEKIMQMPDCADEKAESPGQELGEKPALELGEQSLAQDAQPQSDGLDLREKLAKTRGI